MKEGANGKLGGFLVFQLFTIEVAEAKTNVSSTGRELTALYFFISQYKARKRFVRLLK